jgi:hypothetical protein
MIKDHQNGVQIMKKKIARIKLYPSRSMVEMEEFLGLQFDATPLSLFPKSNQSLDWADVFVVMPFNTELEKIYKDHIKDVCSRLNLTVKRADDFFPMGLLCQRYIPQ